MMETIRGDLPKTDSEWINTSCHESAKEDADRSKPIKKLVEEDANRNKSTKKSVKDADRSKSTR